MHRTIGVLLACAALMSSTALAACGGDDDTGVSAAAKAPASAPAAETPTSTPTADDGGDEAVGGRVDARIEGFAFTPRTIEVEVGQEISWTNRDAAPHTVTATSGDDFDSGSLGEGDAFRWKAEEAGTVEYVCALHPSMAGTIEVR